MGGTPRSVAVLLAAALAVVVVRPLSARAQTRPTSAHGATAPAPVSDDPFPDLPETPEQNAALVTPPPLPPTPTVLVQHLQVRDTERPGAPPPTPATHEDDVLVGAASLVGVELSPAGFADSFSFALRIGGPHYGRADAGNRAFAVDLGLGYVDAGSWHSTTFDLDIRDFMRFDTHAASYVLLGFAGGDRASGDRDDGMFAGSLGVGLEVALVPALCLDVEARVVARLSNGDDGNVGVTAGALFSAGLTVYLGT